MVRNQGSDIVGLAMTWALIGMFIVGSVGSLLLMTTFPPPEEIVPTGMWMLFWLIVPLSGALGAALVVALLKRSELRDLRSYVDTFFYTSDHQAGVDKELKVWAIQADTASKHAINLRTNGVKLIEGVAVAIVAPEHILDECQQIQENADSSFHKSQDKFYKIFDLAAKFAKVFGLQLKSRKFKEYVSDE